MCRHVVKFVVIVAFVVAWMPGAAFAQIAVPKVDPEISQRFAASPKESQEIIIGFRNPQGQLGANTAIKQALGLWLGPERMTTETSDEFLVVSLDQQDVDGLLRSGWVPHVYGIELMRYGTPALNDSTVLIGAVDVWATTINGVPLDGAGQCVCVLDTGTDWSHPDLAAANALGGSMQVACLSQVNPCVVSPTLGWVGDHGTHVAGIVAARGGISGVARGAKLISVKVFVSVGGQPNSDSIRVARGIDWCVANAEKYNITEITTSLAIGNIVLYTGPCDSTFPTTLTPAINAALAKNIAVTAAAGNYGPIQANSLVAPACISGAIAVAASTKQDDVPGFTNYNSISRLFAPGLDIQSCVTGGGYGNLSGTSQSSPHVAGSIAILNQAHRLRGFAPRRLHPKNDCEALLFETGEPITGLDFATWRRINIFNATTRLIATTHLADITEDGLVNIDDLVGVITSWGACQPPTGDQCFGDVSPFGGGNEVVDIDDLVFIIVNWGWQAQTP